MAVSLGLDISATSTGIVVLESSPVKAGELQYLPHLHLEEAVQVKTKGMERCSDIAERVVHAITTFKPDRIAIEDYAPGKFIGSSLVSIEVGAIVRYFTRQLGHKYLPISPKQVKQFATGSGANGVKKDHVMMWVYKRWAHTSLCNDTADAYVLAAMGLSHVGCLSHVTAEQKEIIGAVPYRLP